MKSLLAVLFAFGGVCSACVAMAAPNGPHLVVIPHQIEGLNIQEEVAAGDGLSFVSTQDGLFEVRLHGQFDHPGWTLVGGSKILVKSDAGPKAFEVVVSVTGRKNEVEFDAISPFGQVQKGTLEVDVSDWPAFLDSQRSEKPNPLQASLAFNHVGLSQTGRSDFSESALAVKTEYRVLLFPPYWDLNVGGFFTALPLSSNQSGIEARFLGVNLRLGYRLPFVHEPWEVFIFGGAYYTTMFVTQNAFGYRNELGPQLFPTIRRFFNNGDGISVYAKYSPVTSGFSTLTPDNREIGIGASWLLRLRNQHFISVVLDYTSVHLDFPDLSTTLEANTTSLGIGYLF